MEGRGSGLFGRKEVYILRLLFRGLRGMELTLKMPVRQLFAQFVVENA
jgi:hypothetical protein